MQKIILQHAYQYHMSCVKRWQGELIRLIDEEVELDDSRMLAISHKCDFHTNQVLKIAEELSKSECGTEKTG